MRNLILRFAGWLIRLCGRSVLIGAPAPLVEAARRLVEQEERRSAQGTSGEYKRHRVLAALKDAYPQASGREMARAIEEACGL